MFVTDVVTGRTVGKNVNECTHKFQVQEHGGKQKTKNQRDCYTLFVI